MPARRRRSLVRDPVLRTQMWEAKVKGDIYAQQLEAVKPLALPAVASYQATHEYLISVVKGVLSALGTEQSLVQEYMWYAEKMWKYTQQYGGSALQKQADALYLWYLARGRNDVALRAIAQSLGIKISPLEEIAEAVLAPALISVVGRGTVTADGTEQVLLEYAGRISTIAGYVDLSNMDAGDVVVIRSYVKVSPDEDFRLYRSETFEGRQIETALYLLPRLSGFAMRVTLQQTAGTYKSFDFLFVKGV
jgi:hypothetical protein